MLSRSVVPLPTACAVGHVKSETDFKVIEDFPVGKIRNSEATALAICRLGDMKRSILDLCRTGNGRTLHRLTIIPVGFKLIQHFRGATFMPLVFEPVALRNHLKGKGLTKVRTAPLRLGHNHRRIGQGNRDHNRSRKPLCIPDRQLVIGLSRRLHVAQIQCRRGSPLNHLFPLAPLVSQRLVTYRRDRQLYTFPLNHVYRSGQLRDGRRRHHRKGNDFT